jgi:hypothetical protein
MNFTRRQLLAASAALAAGLALLLPPTLAATSRPLTPKQSFVPQSPSCLILDQDGSGLDLTTSADGVDFDLDGDGSRERIGWTRATSRNGFLVIDVNKNGTIDDGREIVGTALKHPRLTKTMSGFSALLFLQQDVTVGPDGEPKVVGSAQLNADDSVFREFRVWVDANHNGRSDTGELSTLEEAAISELSVAFRRAPEDGNYLPGVALGTPNANTVLLYGRFFVRMKGSQSQRSAFEVRFQRLHTRTLRVPFPNSQIANNR